MAYVALRYPLKIADKSFPRGLKVRLASLEAVRRVFKRIVLVQGSKQVGIWLPGLKHPTLVHLDQLDL